jgi:ABC-2 type transport system ATP-binding protein
MQNSIVFECQNLGHSYKKFRLQGVNIALRTGEITGLIGQNGSGKTTFLRMVVGEMARTEGELHYPQFPPEWHLRKQQIAYIPQELPEWFGTLRENLHYSATLHGFLGETNEALVAATVERLGLTEHIDKRWNQLSGGYKLRVALAQALVWKPKLLIIDEPLANLDINTQLFLLNDLRAMCHNETDPIAVLLSSQHLEEIELYADNILMLDAGKVVYSGKTSEIAAESTESVYEFSANVRFEELESVLVLLDASLTHNGKYFIIRLPPHNDTSKLLHFLLKNGIVPLYFRNISQSVKLLFNDYVTTDIHKPA